MTSQTSGVLPLPSAVGDTDIADLATSAFAAAFPAAVLAKRRCPALLGLPLSNPLDVLASVALQCKHQLDHAMLASLRAC